MLFSLAGSALTALALVQQIDTTVPAQQGQRLVVDALRRRDRREDLGAERRPGRGRSVVPHRPSRSRPAAARSSVRTEGRRGPPSAVDLTITVPAWMGLDLSGVYTDVTVDGVRGADLGGDRPGRSGRDRRRGPGLAALGAGAASASRAPRAGSTCTR